MQHTYDEIMQELRTMRSHFDSGFSVVEKQRIVELYWQILRKQINNIACGDCYRDAFTEIFTHLKRTGQLPEERHYELFPGKMLHIFGTDQYLFEVTDEQAEKFLYQFPDAIDQFKEYPEDWKKRAENRKNREDYKARRAADKAAKKKAEAEAEKVTDENIEQ